MVNRAALTVGVLYYKYQIIMYIKIVNREQLLIGSLVRKVNNNDEIFEIKDHELEEDLYELSIVGGRDDSLSFSRSFENLAESYEVESVDGGFKDEGEI